MFGCPQYLSWKEETIQMLKQLWFCTFWLVFWNGQLFYYHFADNKKHTSKKNTKIQFPSMLGITLSVSFHPGATGAGLFSMSRVHVKVPREREDKSRRVFSGSTFMPGRPLDTPFAFFA